MSEITTIGLDLAKHVFQVHGVDAHGTTVLRKRLRRGQVLAFFTRIPRCVIGLEACATAHYWSRELGALGHEVRLMPGCGLCRSRPRDCLEAQGASRCLHLAHPVASAVAREA